MAQNQADNAAYVERFVTFICPNCGREDDRLSDGVCPGCFYVLTGGDQGTDVPTWQAWLCHGEATR